MRMVAPIYSLVFIALGAVGVGQTHAATLIADIPDGQGTVTCTVIADGTCQCPAGREQNGNSDQCRCKQGYKPNPADNYDTCVQCVGELEPQSDGSCGCTAPKVANANNQCVCPGELTLQSDGSCGCTAPKVQGTNNQCVCPGELTPQSDGSCGCTAPRVQGTNNQCVCTGGQISQSDGSCRCPQDQELGEGGVCVEQCFWKPHNEGYMCYWDDPSKTSLKFNQDCHFSAPVATDVYVKDMRTNKYDTSSPRQDPLISLQSTPSTGSTTTSTYQTTWLDFTTTPKNLEDQLTFTNFGVYNLAMVATDYHKKATCTGCIAIVDKFQPTAINPCQSNGVVSVDYSTSNLDTTVNAENAFRSFYANENVKDNGAVNSNTGANVRDDEKIASKQGFFKDSYENIDFESDCFGGSFVTDLINDIDKQTFNPDGNLECKRCCKKSTILKGAYYPYNCESPVDTAQTFPVREMDKCSFDRCITMRASDLVTASTSITTAANTKSAKIVEGLGGTKPALDGIRIYRSIPCTAFNEADATCKYSAKLGDLFDHLASWANGLSIAKSVDNYVHWYYYVGVDAGKPWNSNDELVFRTPDTKIILRAFTQCGLVQKFEYHVVLYTHSDHDACTAFNTKWAIKAPSPHTLTATNPNDKPAWCAYPGSDFAAMTFNYDINDVMTHADSTVQGTYTNVKCYITVAEDGNLDQVSKVELPLSSWNSGPIKLTEQLALELVHDPTTAADTDVRILCDFTFQHYNETTTQNEPCVHELSITDCDSPEIHRLGDEVCTANNCLSPVGAPGLYEACDGVVFTTASTSVLATTIKALPETCCANCNKRLTCNSLPEASTIKRCEPEIAGSLVALATALEHGEFDSTSMALFGVSAMVAIVALVVVKRRVAAREEAEDDAYHPLLD